MGVPPVRPRQRLAAGRRYATASRMPAVPRAQRPDGPGASGATTSSWTSSPARQISASGAPPGRAARNANGFVIMYADTVTDSMRAAIDETKRRRTIQEAYNKEHGITPKTIIKPIQEAIKAVKPVEDEQADKGAEFTSKDFAALDKEAQAQMIAELTEQMKAAAKRLDFEQAATLRDTVMELTSRMKKK